MEDLPSRCPERQAEARARLIEAALAAWDDYQMTGLHVTGEEVDRWLARLEAGEDVPAPEAHR
jgi:predicted transcriptional regulator